MKRFTRSDNTACSRCQANQFRLFLHMGAYWLLHTLRAAAPKRSRWRGATFETIRRMFVKIAVRVEELKGKIRLVFPLTYPQTAMLAAMTGVITTRGLDRCGIAAWSPIANPKRVRQVPEPAHRQPGRPRPSATRPPRRDE